MIRCAKCGGLKRHSEMAGMWNNTDATGRVTETVGLCKACEVGFRAELETPNSQAARMLGAILTALAKRGPTRCD
jgi:hypothetical protein